MVSSAAVEFLWRSFLEKLMYRSLLVHLGHGSCYVHLTVFCKSKHIGEQIYRSVGWNFFAGIAIYSMCLVPLTECAHAGERKRWN